MERLENLGAVKSLTCVKGYWSSHLLTARSISSRFFLTLKQSLGHRMNSNLSILIVLAFERLKITGDFYFYFILFF
jgi:hypothetical protein